MLDAFFIDALYAWHIYLTDWNCSPTLLLILVLFFRCGIAWYVATKNAMKIKMRQLLIPSNSKLCIALRWKFNFQCVRFMQNETIQCDAQTILSFQLIPFIAIKNEDYIVLCLHFCQLPSACRAFAPDHLMMRIEMSMENMQDVALIWFGHLIFMKMVVESTRRHATIVIRIQMITFRVSRGLNWVQMNSSKEAPTQAPK